MTSQSPPSKQKAFQWPIPNSPINKSTNNNNEISVREIIEKYYPNDKELLKHALMAKAEEDKVKYFLYIQDKNKMIYIYIYIYLY